MHTSLAELCWFHVSIWWCSMGTHMLLDLTIHCQTTPFLLIDIPGDFTSPSHVCPKGLHFKQSFVPSQVDLWYLSACLTAALFLHSSVLSSVPCWSPLPTSLYWNCPGPSQRHCSPLPSSPLVSCLIPWFLGDWLPHYEWRWKSIYLRILSMAQCLSNFRIG